MEERLVVVRRFPGSASVCEMCEAPGPIFPSKMEKEQCRYCFGQQNTADYVVTKSVAIKLVLEGIVEVIREYNTGDET